MIQELVEDEDYSSVASNTRMSQMMQMAEEVSNRPSVFSLKNEHMKPNNSPFQQVDASARYLTLFEEQPE